MYFEIITVIEGFGFYQLSLGDHYELWICNRGESAMEMVVGRREEYSAADVLDLWSAGYFVTWTKDRRFTY